MTLLPNEPTPADDAPKGWTTFSHPAADHRGAVFGDRFEVGELLGAGGASWVYACRDRVLRNVAAVKILKEGGADARRRFLEEGRILGSLRHPHLVQALAVGEERGEAFMVLELLPGRSLDQRLQDEGPLPWREVVVLIAQVAEALAALHRAGVIHRDVKPSNIVQLGSATDRPLVKLIDLGIAKVEDWGRLQSGGFTPPVRHQTATGLIVGTPGFQAPEVSRTRPDARFDIFALGVTIFVLCTGEMPDLMAPRSMREVRPECDAPPELEALVAASLAVDPAQRIGSAAEVMKRLDAVRTAHAEASTPYLFDGCYELLEVLGVGAKAEVYRAYHRDALRYVALKLPTARTREDPEECVRFAREAQVLSVVKHPALPELVECRTSPSRAQPYIAMALVRGKRASEFCVAPRCLEPADAIAVGKQLAGALAAMHARGILHRDVHGGNVLIDLGREPTAVLIDVGMVECTDRFYVSVEQRYPTPPEHRRKLGTGGLERLEWTAPEARASKVWSEKCDVYSLGLLLYKLLTGKRPTKGNTRELVSPQQFVPRCPTALASALLAALHDDPAERVDAAGLLAKLDAAADEMTEDDSEEGAEGLAAESVTHVPPTAASPSTGAPEPRRRRWNPVAVAAAAAIAVAAIGWSWWYGGAASPTTTSAVADTPVVAAASATKREPALSSPPVDAAKPTAPPTRPTMREAIDAVAGELRRCATLAGGTLILELTAEGEALTGVSVQGADDKDVVACVHGVLDPLRFAPTPAQFFTEEFTP